MNQSEIEKKLTSFSKKVLWFLETTAKSSGSNHDTSKKSHHSSKLLTQNNNSDGLRAWLEAFLSLDNPTNNPETDELAIQIETSK